MRNRKRRMEAFSFYDHTGISKHLEKMASQGWMIEKISNFGWLYQKIEPKKLHFNVTYYPKASEFDPEPSEEQKSFYDFCEYTGWKLACASAQMQVFYNEKENPTPLETDPVIEVDTLHKACKKTLFPSLILLLFLVILNFGVVSLNMYLDPISLFATPVKISTILCYIILFIYCIAEFITYFIWYTKAKKVAENGIFLETPNTTILQKALLICTLIILLYWTVPLILNDSFGRIVVVLSFLYIGTLIYLVNTIKNYLKRRKTATGTNRILTFLSSFILSFTLMIALTFFTFWGIEHGLFNNDEETYEHNGETFVIHNDELPLCVEDIFNIKYEEYNKELRTNESFLLAEYVIRQHARFDAEKYKEMPTLDYTIVIVKAPFLYDTCKNELFNRGDNTWDNSWPEEMVCTYKSIDPTIWKATEVYTLYFADGTLDNRYLLCYDDYLIDIEFDRELTEEQIAIVVEKLTN